MQLEAKISFCSLPEQRVTCRVNDPVLVTKGQGQFSFQLETPPLCDCRRPLIAKSSWQDGVYNYIQDQWIFRCWTSGYIDAGPVDILKSCFFHFRYVCYDLW